MSTRFKREVAARLGVSVRVAACAASRICGRREDYRQALSHLGDDEVAELITVMSRLARRTDGRWNLEAAEKAGP